MSRITPEHKLERDEALDRIKQLTGGKRRSKLPFTVNIKRNKEGRYFVFNARKIYIGDDVTRSDLVKWLINQLLTRRKRTTKRKAKRVPTPFPRAALPTDDAIRSEMKLHELRQEYKKQEALPPPLPTAEEIAKNVTGEMKRQIEDKVKELMAPKQPSMPIPVRRSPSQSSPQPSQQDIVSQLKNIMGSEGTISPSKVLAKKTPRAPITRSMATIPDIEDRARREYADKLRRIPLAELRKLAEQHELKFEPDATKETIEHALNQKFVPGQGRNGGPGLTDVQLQDIMEPYRKAGFKGIVSSDELHKIVPFIKAGKPFGFIMNLDPSWKGGSHWVSVYGDPDQLCYYDSFADYPSEDFMRDILPLVKKEGGNKLLKFKVNRVQQQMDSSDHCGFFAAKFLRDMFHGKKFSDATGWKDRIINDSKKGEDEIDKFKKQVGYGFPLIGGRGIVDVLRQGHSWIRRKRIVSGALKDKGHKWLSNLAFRLGYGRVNEK